MTQANTRTVHAIDPQSLPKHFDSAVAEKRFDELWDKLGIHHYDASKPRSETFVVDTPPPTVSGSLHIGHVFSYTHPDLVARYKRMRGINIFYPMGWDDNGLPTERRVQNYYHVRCEPHVPYEPDLVIPPADAKTLKGQPRLVSRKNFIELCHQLTEVDEAAFMGLFRRLGLSIDWRQTYATIDDRCRKIAQLSFLDLFDKGLAYQNWAPTMWDVDYQTAVAQAEVEERSKPGAYHHIEFGVEGSDESFVIATTRPELLPACVGVTAHPEDERYKHLFGRNAVTPLFHAPVPIFPSELADPTKGSGILMVCTFGDQTDVLWWREQKLALRQLLEKNGRLRAVTFGDEEFPSLKPSLANENYAQLVGKNVTQARAAVIELLKEPGNSATGKGAPLQKEPQGIEHMVKFYEKGERPLELLSTRQWFVRLLEHKERLLAKGDEIKWHPEFMRIRYRDWTENLSLDWCVSRQRYFGVPIPVWYRLDAAGNPDFQKPILPTAAQLPVDPMSDVPEGYTAEQRDQPNGFTGETDIFDTWFTSSLTPQIGSNWGLDETRHQNLFPADIRPQSHEIIRTWAFYTIAKALLHEDKVPWTDVMISGWILDPDRKKMSKSKGNVVIPTELLEEWGVDAVRYWAASARLGTDTAFDPTVFKIGKRLVTKLFNAGKFVLSQGGVLHPITEELDQAFVAELRQLVEKVTADFEQFKYAQALQDVETFFWTRFTDTYLELAKPRAWGGEEIPEAKRGSALSALRLGLNVLLRLFAPFLPYITEEVWSWSFAAETEQPSIHGAAWPSAGEFASEAPSRSDSFQLAVDAFTAINKSKTEAGVSAGRVAKRLTLVASPDTLAAAAGVLSDVAAAARCETHSTQADPALEFGVFQVKEAEFAEKPAKE
jgi:valyl-tRNA synthetase